MGTQQLRHLMMQQLMTQQLRHLMMQQLMTQQLRPLMMQQLSDADLGTQRHQKKQHQKKLQQTKQHQTHPQPAPVSHCDCDKVKESVSDSNFKATLEEHLKTEFESDVAVISTTLDTSDEAAEGDAAAGDDKKDETADGDDDKADDAETADGDEKKDETAEGDE